MLQFRQLAKEANWVGFANFGRHGPGRVLIWWQAREFHLAVRLSVQSKEL